MGFPVIDPFLSVISLPTTTKILDWVTGDPDALRNAANGWTVAAGEVKETSTELQNGLTEVVDNWSGDAYKEFVDYMGKVLVELGKEEAAMLAISGKLNGIANALAVGRDKVVRILVRLAAALIPLAAIALFPPAGAASLAAGVALTTASFAAIIVVTQALSGVLQGIPDLLNDLEGMEFTPHTLGDIPDALPKKVPLGAWGPQPDGPAGGAPAPVSTGGSPGGAPAASGAPSTAAGSAPMAPSAPAPVAAGAPTTPAGANAGLTPGTGGVPVTPSPATPTPVPPPVLTPPAGPPCVPPVAPPVAGAGMDSGLPPGYGWAAPHAPLPLGWHRDGTTGQILPPGATPSGNPPAGLLPGYGWIAPGTELPVGWSVDPATDVLVGPVPPTSPAPPSDSSGWEATMRPGGSAFLPASLEGVPG